MNLVWTTLFLVGCLAGLANADCRERKYDQESFVCVCDAQQCDQVQPPGNIRSNTAAVYTTGRDAGRLTKNVEVFGPLKAGYTRARIIPDKRYQRIVGFGGAITDSVMLILHELRNTQTGECKLCELLQNQYYGENSISYTLGRVNLGSCDFSDREYSYLEQDQDFELKSFKLSEFEYNKTDFLREAIAKTNGKLKLFASPWSAPAWMKTSGKMKGGGTLKGIFNGIYHLTYARYFLRFFEEYHKKGVDFWGLTLINEPGAGRQKDYNWQAMWLAPDEQRKFVEKRLGPILKNNWLTKDIKILAHDDQRDNLFDSAQKIYQDKETMIDGLGVHWYAQSSFDTLALTHALRPDKLILATEACNGYLPEEQMPLLGSWYYGERYAQDIINNLLNFAAGWTDWNIWLNELGGPNWVGNFVDSPIIVNITGQEFYKQPMYYVLGHFSKFIVPDSERVHIKVDGFQGKESDEFQAVAFDTHTGYYVTVLHNRNSFKTYEIALGVGDFPSTYAPIKVAPKSIKTVIFRV